MFENEKMKGKHISDDILSREDVQTNKQHRTGKIKCLTRNNIECHISKDKNINSSLTLG